MLKKLDINILNCKNEYVDAIVYHNGYYNYKNVEIVKEYPFINAVGVHGKIENIKKLSYLASVSYVCSVSKIYNLAGNFSKINFNRFTNLHKNTIFASQYEYDNINKYTNIMYKSFFNNKKTNRYSTCVLDTGVSRHMDLSCFSNRLLYQKDCENGIMYPYDDNGHGTFVAGVIAGNGILSGKKIVGISPNTNIISVKIMNSRGESNVFCALDGMQWIADNYKKYNIKTVCMSFGAVPIDNDPLVVGVDSLSKLGLIVVSASGNSGLNTYMSPAVSSNVISVGSVDKNNNISEFTSRGVYNGKEYPFIYTRGENVISLSNTGTYVSMSGTSVACPIVCGYICNLLENYNNLTLNDVKKLLLNASIYKDNVPILDIM